MRYIMIAFLAACGMTQRPGDILGPGTMCRPVSEVKQECWDPNGTPHICVDQGGRWTCREMRD